MCTSFVNQGLPVAAMFTALLLGSLQASAQLAEEELEALDARAYGAVRRGDPLAGPERQAVVVLTAYNKTNFFIDAEGRYRGFEYDILKGFEAFINKGRKKASERHKLFFIPMQFDGIVRALAEGRGDIAAANLTITEERQEIVDFTDAYLPNVNEIVVANRAAPAVETVEDLSGRTILVLAGTSYVEHLEAVNERFKRERREPIDIVQADPDLDHADVLDLVNVGAVEFTVADEHIARVWAPGFPDIVLKPEVAISAGGRIAWAVRKDAPELKKRLNAYVRKIKKGTLKGNIAFKDYYESRRWVKNPLDQQELRKLNDVVRHMKTYGEKYGWDWIAVAAQAYQESRLDQSKVSSAGAVGIMQLLPSTAAHKPIGIRDIEKVDNNIHAGVKYLSFLRKRYFNEPGIDPAARIDFSWAAYNAGPARIQKLRKRAEERGFDPNKWFNHVEHMASETIGRETVDYVINVNKYYVAYKFALERQERILASREARAREARAARQQKALEAWRTSYATRRK